LILTAAIAAAVMFYIGATLPAAPIGLDGQSPPEHVAGAYHVHSVRSGGTGTIDEIAAAAAAAGLRFVVLTDHGDGTRPPDPPAYRHGVLVIDAVEISTDAGHVVALGLASPAPYPLAGGARDVIDDIHRLGGVAVIAHPDSPKPDLRWRAQGVPFDGLEWLNADSEWRDESAVRLLGAAARSLLRPEGAVASLFARPSRTLQRWDAAAASRPVFGLAAVDAHARIPWGGDHDSGGRTLAERPSYRAMFGTLAQVAMVARPLAGDAAADAALLLDALIRGRSFSVVRALASPAPLAFEAVRGETRAGPGDRLAVEPGETRFRARLPGAPGVRLVILHDGRPAAAGHGQIELSSSMPGAYRVEAMFPGASVPWVVSNPIAIGGAAGDGRAPGPESADEAASADVEVPLAAGEWTVEREPSSEARLMEAGAGLQLDYRLGGGRPAGQYAALVNPVRREAGINRVQFTARASAPMRLSVQVRLPGGPGGQRWRRSVYLDTTPRTVVVRLADFEPAEVATSRRPIAVPVQALLFVVDTINTAPGTAGSFWISDVRLGLAALPR
jgi:hypothetical protein